MRYRVHLSKRRPCFGKSTVIQNGTFIAKLLKALQSGSDDVTLRSKKMRRFLKTRAIIQFTQYHPGQKRSCLIMGRRSLRAKIRQTFDLAQSKVVFSPFNGSGPKVGPKWVSGSICEEKGPETHFGPIFWPLPAHDEKPTFDPLLCQINCLTSLAPRDLRPIITPVR